MKKRFKKLLTELARLSSKISLGISDRDQLKIWSLENQILELDREFNFIKSVQSM